MLLFFTDKLWILTLIDNHPSIATTTNQEVNHPENDFRIFQNNLHKASSFICCLLAISCLGSQAIYAMFLYNND